MSDPLPMTFVRNYDYRIKQSRDGKAIVVWTSPTLQSDDGYEFALRQLESYRALAPKDVKTWIERQDITPTEWEPLDA